MPAIVQGHLVNANPARKVVLFAEPEADGGPSRQTLQPAAKPEHGPAVGAG
jgi:hypothetical protein